MESDLNETRDNGEIEEEHVIMSEAFPTENDFVGNNEAKRDLVDGSDVKSYQDDSGTTNSKRQKVPDKFKRFDRKEWSPECEAALQKKRQAYEKFRRHSTEQNKREYGKARGHFRLVFREYRQRLMDEEAACAGAEGQETLQAAETEEENYETGSAPTEEGAGGVAGDGETAPIEGAGVNS